MISALVGLLVLIGAAAIGGLEFAMGPKQRRFPCVNAFTIWVLRLYTLSLAGAAYDRLWNAYNGSPLPWTPFQVGAAIFMALAHVVLFSRVLRMRLPEGVWPYLQIRYERARKASKVGGDVGATLAKAAVDPRRNVVDTGLYQPPREWTGVLALLLRRP